MKFYVALLAGLAALSQALPATVQPPRWSSFMILSAWTRMISQICMMKTWNSLNMNFLKLIGYGKSLKQATYLTNYIKATFQKQFPKHAWVRIQEDLPKHSFAQVDRGPGKDWVRTGKKNDWLCPPGKVKEGGIDCYWTVTFVDPTIDKSGPSCSSKGGQYKKGWTGSGVDWKCSV